MVTSLIHSAQLRGQKLPSSSAQRCGLAGHHLHTLTGRTLATMTALFGSAAPRSYEVLRGGFSAAPEPDRVAAQFGWHRLCHPAGVAR